MKKKEEIYSVDEELKKLNKQSAELENMSDENKRLQKRKKTIVWSLVSIVAVFLIAIAASVIYIETQSPISYGPAASDSEKTEEKTKEHERRIKLIDENGGVREGVNFVGYNAFFDKENNLIVDGYFRNFTGHEIHKISGNVTITAANDENVAGAYFEFDDESFGSIKNGKSRPWRLIFDEDYVNVDVTDLSSFTITTELEYFQK